MKRIFMFALIVVANLEAAGRSNTPCRVGSLQPSNVTADESHNPCKVGKLNIDRKQLEALDLQKRGTTTAGFDTDFPNDTATRSVSSPLTPSSALTAPHEEDLKNN